MLKWLRPTHLHRLRMSLNHSSDLQLLRFLDLAPLLKSTSRPVKQLPALRHLQFSLLVRASLLTSISRPVKLRAADRLQLLSFLDRAPLLPRISLPVKLNLTDLVLWIVVPTLRTLTDHLLPTGHCPLILLTPVHRHYIKPEGIAYLACHQGLIVCRTNPLWTYTQKKKVNYLKTRISLLPTRINQCRRNKLQRHYARHTFFYGLVQHSRTG